MTRLVHWVRPFPETRSAEMRGFHCGAPFDPRAASSYRDQATCAACLANALSQDTRLVLASNMVHLAKQMRSLPEADILGHLAAFYVHALQEYGDTLEAALAAVRNAWQTPVVENDNGA